MEVDPEYALSMINLASILPDKQESQRLLDKLFRINHEDGLVWIRLMRRLNDPEDVAFCLENAKKFYPDHWLVGYTEAIIGERQNDKSKMLKGISKALSLDEDKRTRITLRFQDGIFGKDRDFQRLIRVPPKSYDE